MLMIESGGCVLRARARSAAKAVSPLADAFDHLRWSQDLELRTHGPQRKGRPVERVGRHSQPAAALVDDLHGAPVAEGGANAGGRGVHERLHDVDRRGVGDTRPDERGRVGGGQLPVAKPTPGAPEAPKAVEPEGTPVLSTQVEGDQIPAPPEGHEPVRLNAPVAGFAPPPRISEPDHFFVPAGLRYGGEQRGVDRRSGVPNGGNGHGVERIDPPAEARGHDLHDLGESPDGGLLDAGNRSLSPRSQADRQGYRLIVIDRQRGQGGAGGELVPTVDPAIGFDRVAELAQSIDVSPDGADGDAEPPGQLGPRPVAVALEQRKQLKRSGTCVRHRYIIAAIEVKNCPLWPIA
jgi:hypothetical protein